MKLEYRILEVAEGSKSNCNYCLLDLWSENDLEFKTAAHEMVAYDEKGDCVDIAYICADCKKDFENDILPYCELCGRLKRNRKACFCDLLKDRRSRQPISEETLTTRSFGYRLESKTRELEKELSTTKEELKIEREEIAKFQEKSEEWGKKQKKVLLDRIKKLETENAELILENQQLKEQKNDQVAQIEVKENKRWSWLKVKK